MKKTYIILLAAASLFVGCNKEIDNPDDNGGQKWPVRTFQATMAEEITVKTTLGDEDGHKSVSWADGDKIRLIYGASAADSKVASVLANGAIEAEVPAAPKYCAVYPALEATMNDSLMFVTIPSVQDGSFASANIMAACCAGDENILAFRNLAGLLKLEVTSDDITKIEIRGNGGEAIAGTQIIRFAEGGIVAEGIDSLSISNVITLNVNGKGTYYAALAKDTDLSKGLGLRYWSGEKVKGAVLSKNALTAYSSVITNLGSPDTRLVEGDYYFKEGGTGNGSSWDDAGGEELLRNIISAVDEDGKYGDGITYAWRIDGKNLRIAAGTYNMSLNGQFATVSASGADHFSFGIYGGYPANASGTSLEGRDIAANTTILTAQSSATTNRVLYIMKSDIDLIVDGIQFSGITSTGRCGAFYMNTSVHGTVTFNDCVFKGISNTSYAGVLQTDSDGTLNLNRCTFESNVSTYASSAFSGGNLMMTNVGTTNITDCVFKGNTSAACGGAIFAYGVSDKVNECKVNIKGCTFEGNQAVQGGAMVVGHASVSCENCTFKSNVAGLTNANYGGGAISFFCRNATVGDSSVGSGNLSLKNCDFIDNTSGASGTSFGRGAAIYKGGPGTLSVEGGTISGNKCYGNGGGAVMICYSTAGRSTFNGVTFRNNAALGKKGGDCSGGAIMTAKDASSNVIFVNNCTFEGNASTGSSSVPGQGAAINMLNASKSLYIFGSTFLNNASTYNTSVVSAATNKFLIANCSFAEGKCDYGIINNSGSTSKIVNNIVLGSANYSLGSAGAILSGGYNVYGTSTVTVNVDSGVSDANGVEQSDVWASPTLDSNGKLPWSGSLSAMTAFASADYVKSQISSFNSDFYAWLESVNAFASYTGTTWWPGAYQN